MVQGAERGRIAAGKQRPKLELPRHPSRRMDAEGRMTTGGGVTLARKRKKGDGPGGVQGSEENMQARGQGNKLKVGMHCIINTSAWFGQSQAWVQEGHKRGEMGKNRGGRQQRTAARQNGKAAAAPCRF